MVQDDGFDWVYYLDVLNKGQYRRMLAQEVDGLRAENARLSRAVLDMEAGRARIPMKAPPMTDDAMIERVARAICATDCTPSASIDEYWPAWVPHARAAIKASEEDDPARFEVVTAALSESETGEG